MISLTWAEMIGRPQYPIPKHWDLISIHNYRKKLAIMIKSSSLEFWMLELK